MSDEKTRFTLRIDTEILEKVKESAKNNRRSAAMEIEFALDAYYKSKRIVDYEKLINRINQADEENDSEFAKEVSHFLETR